MDFRVFIGSPYMHEQWYLGCSSSLMEWLRVGRAGVGIYTCTCTVHLIAFPPSLSSSPHLQDRMYPIKLVQDHPIFRRSELPWPAGPGVTHLTVTNNFASMVIVGNLILRFPVDNPRNVDRKYIHVCTQALFLCSCIYNMYISNYMC